MGDCLATFRIVRFLAEIDGFQNMFTCFGHIMGPPAYGLLGTLFTSFYIYSIIGVILFRGKMAEINDAVEDGDDGGVDWGFDTVLDAMVTLFCEFAAYADALTENYVTVKNEYVVRVYFMSWWIFSCLILMNLVAGFILDAYMKVMTSEKHAAESKYHDMPKLYVMMTKKIEQSDLYAGTKLTYVKKRSLVVEMQKDEEEITLLWDLDIL